MSSSEYALQRKFFNTRCEIIRYVPTPGPPGPPGTPGVSVRQWSETANGVDLYRNDGGNIGIGTSTPSFPLDVHGILHAADTLLSAGTLIPNKIEPTMSINSAIATQPSLTIYYSDFPTVAPVGNNIVDGSNTSMFYFTDVTLDAPSAPGDATYLTLHVLNVPTTALSGNRTITLSLFLRFQQPSPPATKWFVGSVFVNGFEVDSHTIEGIPGGRDAVAIPDDTLFLRQDITFFKVGFEMLAFSSLRGYF